MKEQAKFIDLPNGSSIRADAIFAVRIGDKEKLEHSGITLKPRVIIDFGLQSCDNYGMRSGTNSSIVEFDDNESRDDFKLSLMLQLRYENPKAYRDEVKKTFDDINKALGNGE